MLHVDNCSPNFGAWQMKRIEHHYTSIIELFPAPYKGEIYSDKASRTFRRYRTLGNDKTELEILSKNSLCPLLFTKLCINFCSNIFDKIYKLLLLQRYLYVLLRFLISVCIILSCTLCFKFSYESFTTSYVFPILFTSGIRVIYAYTFAWYLIGVGKLRIHWPSAWGGPGKLS